MIASTDKFCEDCGYDFERGVPASPSPASADRWEAVATADRAYYDRLDSEGIDFPTFSIDRRFTLTGEQVAIGRRSMSKGISPGIDLSGAPEDVGVSHQHAILIRHEDTWSVVDPGSTNGTFLNDGADPLPPNEPSPLRDGDRIHLGAWTTLTLRKVETAQAPG